MTCTKGVLTKVEIQMIGYVLKDLLCFVPDRCLENAFDDTKATIRSSINTDSTQIITA